MFTHFFCNLFLEICGGPPYPPESFDRILLDGPCSALGQRPSTRNKMSINSLKSYSIYQRKLLKTVGYFLCGLFLFCLSLSCVHLILPVSLDCPFLISSSIFSNVYYAENDNKLSFILQSVHLPYKYAMRINFCFIRTRRINFSAYD